jgi:hypothetical protein
MLQSSPKCISEEELDRNVTKYENTAIPPQSRKRKMTTRGRNAFLSVKEALEPLSPVSYAKAPMIVNNAHSHLHCCHPVPSQQLRMTYE